MITSPFTVALIETQSLTSYQKEPFFVILIKLVAKGTGRTSGRDSYLSNRVSALYRNYYNFILFTLINNYTNYLSTFYVVFYYYPLLKNNKQPIKT